MRDSEKNHLTVSIIVPVFNRERSIKTFLKSLMSQDYDKNLYEIIIVDNKSTDKTRDKVKNFEVKLILEHNNLNSPYSARNRGIEKAKGHIIALLDSSCIPKKDWLSNGIRCLYNKKADIVGGNVQFRYYGQKTPGKVFDAKANVQMKESIRNRNVAKAGNLFIRRKVFDKIGLFPEGIRSGGDIIWTRRATKAGFNLVYCESAYVNYSAKPLSKLIKKQWRVQSAKPTIWFDDTQNYIAIFKRFLKNCSFIPRINQNIKVHSLKSENKKEDIKKYKLQLFFISLLLKIILIIANYVGIFKIKNLKI